MNNITPFVIVFMILLLGCLVLWSTGRLVYIDGVVYLLVHRRTEDSMVPNTSGIGVQLLTFVLSACVFSAVAGAIYLLANRS